MFDQFEIVSRDVYWEHEKLYDIEKSESLLDCPPQYVKYTCSPRRETAGRGEGAGSVGHAGLGTILEGKTTCHLYRKSLKSLVGRQGSPPRLCPEMTFSLSFSDDDMSPFLLRYLNIRYRDTIL
jgi:hypothetical protein